MTGGNAGSEAGGDSAIRTTKTNAPDSVKSWSAVESLPPEATSEVLDACQFVGLYGGDCMVVLFEV